MVIDWVGHSSHYKQKTKRNTKVQIYFYALETFWNLSLLPMYTMHEYSKQIYLK